MPPARRPEPNPLAITPYSTFLRPVPVPGVPFDEGDQVCVRFSETWRSYILGALEVLRWKDMWKGSESEVEDTLHEVEALYAAIAAGSCTDMTTFYDIRGVGCTLEIQRTEEGPWEQVADFSACGAEGPPGPPGPQGEQGAAGDSCDPESCNSAASATGPYETVTLVDEDNACGFASGMALWMHGEFEASLLLAKQLFEAGQTVATIAISLLEAVPILGGLASAILAFAEFAETITFELLEYAESDEWHDWIKCKCFCYFQTHREVSLAGMENFLSWLQNEAWTLPPQGPLLVVIGQPFAGFIAGAHHPSVLRRANFYAQQESIDCIDCECPFDWLEDFLGGDDWHAEFVFREGFWGSSPGCYGSYDPVDDRVVGCTPVPGSAVGTWFNLELPADTTITAIIGKVAWNRTREYLTDIIFHVLSQENEGEIVEHETWERDEGGPHVEQFGWDGSISYSSGDGRLILGGGTRNNEAGDGSYWRLIKLSIAGKGPNPFE